MSPHVILPRPGARAIGRWLPALLVLAACQSTVGARFRDQPLVVRSDDRRAIPVPTERGYQSLPYMADVLAFDPIVDSLDRPRHVAAADTNALDEAPDSTWFENRIGVRTISPTEAARGPDTIGPPQPPYTITRAKAGGNNPGFLMRDVRGIRYLVKFDTAENPEQQTGTNVIVNRIFWTVGYRVPADHVFTFRRAEVILPPETAAKYHLGERDIDRMLASATHVGDGYRATASQFLDGKPRGGWPRTGTRADDPNDRVPHERRRVLRGLRLFAAWLGHTDMKEDNTLDMYVGEPGQGYLMHYLVDFGEALGGHQSEKRQLQVGWEYGWDWGNQLRALASFGLWKRPWEGQVETPWRSVGYFGADHFDPRRWRERYPYAPFAQMDRADAFWAARLIMRFDRPMLEAIVAEAKFSEPAAAAYLVDSLMARRAKIGAAYLDGVTPLDGFELRPGQLCAVDLARQYGLRAGDVIVDGHAYAEDGAGRVCVPASTAPGYHVLRARVRTSRGQTPPLEIHYSGGPAPHLLGLVR
jgi:hypothetical protein